jgi:outer membrane pore protein F
LTYGEDKNKARSWGTAVKYDANNIYIAALYTETRDAARITNNNLTTDNDGFANKAVTTEVIAQYQFDFGLRPSIAYVQSKGKDIEGIGDADLYKYYEVGATYYFNKNMSTYVDYKINRLDDNNPLGLATDDVVALGLVYQF